MSQATPASGLKARLIALLTIAVGAAVGWYFGYEALRQAQARAPSIDFSGKALLLSGLLIFSGLFLLIGGRPVLEAFSGPPRGRQHLIVWPMFVLGCLAGGVAWWWLRGQLHALGYPTA